MFLPREPTVITLTALLFKCYQMTWEIANPIDFHLSTKKAANRLLSPGLDPAGAASNLQISLLTEIKAKRRKMEHATWGYNGSGGNYCLLKNDNIQGLGEGGFEGDGESFVTCKGGKKVLNGGKARVVDIAYPGEGGILWWGIRNKRTSGNCGGKGSFNGGP